MGCRELSIYDYFRFVKADLSPIALATGDGSAEFAITPQATENPVYDSAGRKISDSLWTYSWDAADHLISVESKIPLDNAKYVRVDFAYDYSGRRIKKSVSKKSSPSDSWLLTSDFFFYYDQVLLNGSPADFGVLTAEKIINHETNEVREFQYVWGLDIDGRYQGLGGVGGLLTVIDKTHLKVYLPCSDAKGTIHSYVDADTGSEVAKFAYNPYGGITSSSCSIPDAHFSFLYSSKYYDPETQCYNYGLRILEPATCRWLNRDPIEEKGGLNQYATCNNDPVNNVDILGCDAYIVYRKFASEELEKCYPLIGHVYLAFDKEHMGKKWEEALESYRGVGINGQYINPDSGIHTFSFHPWSVKHTDYYTSVGTKYPIVERTTGDRIGKFVTDSSDVWYNDFVHDIDPFTKGLVIKGEITSNEDEQIRLFKNAVHSFLINAGSPLSNDYGYYSILKNNCEAWARRMIANAGLNVPLSFNVTALTGPNLGTKSNSWLNLPTGGQVRGITGSILTDVLRSSVDAYDMMRNEYYDTIGGIVVPFEEWGRGGSINQDLFY